jgi:sigma-B regulation protein RsbU (phosphoserine phosphatase)
MFPSATYDEQTVQAQAGDAIVFVSDGILDAENAQDEMYGEDRLATVLCGHRDRPAAEIAEAILQDVSRFQGGKERFDDETIIVLRCRA